MRNVVLAVFSKELLSPNEREKLVNRVLDLDQLDALKRGKILSAKSVLLSRRCQLDVQT